MLSHLHSPSLFGVSIHNQTHCFPAWDTCLSLSGSVGGGRQTVHLPSSELCPGLPALVGTKGVMLLVLEIWWDRGVAYAIHYRPFPLSFKTLQLNSLLGVF